MKQGRQSKAGGHIEFKKEVEVNGGKAINTIISGLMIMALAAMPLIVACAKPAPAPTPAPVAKPSPAAAPAPVEKLPQQFIFAASGKGKVYDLSAYYSEMITKYTPMKASIEMTPGSVASLQMVAADTAQAFAISAPAAKPPSMEKKLALRTLFCGAGLEGSTIIGIFTKPGAGIKSVKDLKGKKVYVDKPANIWPAPVMDALLKVNGMTREDFTYLKFENAEDCFKALKEGRVDAFLYLAGSGTLDMAQTVGLYVVPLTPQEQQALEDLGTGWVKVVWTKGAFGNPTDTPTVATPILFYSSPKVSESTVYTVVKTMFDHLKEFQSSQKAAEGFTLENALLVFAFPYHPGAIKYFKEIGIWTKEHDAKQRKAEDEWRKTLGG